MPFRLSQALTGPLLICSLVTALACSTAPEARAQASSSSSPSVPSSVQKANAEEAAVIERILNRVRFENDGTEVSETEAVVRIQSQAGVEEFGQLVFGY